MIVLEMEGELQGAGRGRGDEGVLAGLGGGEGGVEGFAAVC